MPRVLKRNLLVLGCGRSGTLYTCKVFAKAGMDLGHERVGTFGCCSMYFVTPKTDCSAVSNGQRTPIHKDEKREDYEFKHVWHQIRHPLKTIDSLAKSFSRKVRIWTHEQLGVALPGKSGNFQCSLEDKIAWAMSYWVINNELCEKQADWTYKIEVFPWEEMCNKLGLGNRGMPNVSTTTNRGLRFAFKSKLQSDHIRETMHDTTWDTLRKADPSLMSQVKNLAEHYGYI